MRRISKIVIDEKKIRACIYGMRDIILSIKVKSGKNIINTQTKY